MMAFGNWKLIFVIALGVFLRFSFRYSSYYGEISKRVEVSSPVSAWIRVVEGVKLKQLNIQPYDGNTFHESPIFLNFYQFIVNNLSEFQIVIFFILIDMMTAFILSNVSIMQLNSMKIMEKNRLKIYLKDNDDKKSCEKLFINPATIYDCAEWIIWIYALSPYSILPCVAQSTQVLQNFLISLIMLTASNGQRFLSFSLLALSVVNTFYSLLFLSPVILILENSAKNTDDSKPQQLTIRLKSLVYSLFIFMAILISFLLLCLWIENGSIQFIHSTYVFMWTVSDLTPNIGLFWYFFAEMFDHFRTFFIWVFQINYFLYLIPLTLKLNENPYFLFMITLINHSIFKPYPTVSDFALYLCMLPQWSHLFEYMKSTLVVSGTIATTSVLAPILWYLWIVLGTANSNFYFGITLAFNIGQIFLLTDLIFAYIKREFYFNNIELYKIYKKTGKSLPVELRYN